MHALIERRYFKYFSFFLSSQIDLCFFFCDLEKIVFVSLCVAIGALKEEARKGSSVMASNGGEGAKLETDKKSWMSSAQLWISNPNSQLQSVIFNQNQSFLCCVILQLIILTSFDHVLF